MNHAEARELLLLYRGEQDRSVEGMSEALALLEQDADLKRWFDQLQQVRAAERAALRGVAPPPGLKEAILRDRKVVQVPLWRRREFISAVAASVAVAAGAIFFASSGRVKPELTLENFERRMLNFAVRSYAMDIETTDPKAVRDLLASKSAPSDFALPALLQTLPVKGGGKLSWNERPVAMMCFTVQGETGYLFVMDEQHLPEKPAAQTQLGSFGELSTAVWRTDGRVYLLGAKVPQEELRKLVSG